ncbi:MAG TPA: cytochrome c family protein [Stellaceae bacterium]|nr:cytochrome c family protein [Stellaceae bacterium]
MRVLALSGVALCMLSLPATAAADATKGKSLFEACAKCHSITAESDSTLVGPTLKGVVGRKAASIEDFRYSSAMRASGLTWTEENIKEYITDPQAKVKGNRMALKSSFEPNEIDDLIAYLKTLK